MPWISWNLPLFGQDEVEMLGSDERSICVEEEATHWPFIELIRGVASKSTRGPLRFPSIKHGVWTILQVAAFVLGFRQFIGEFLSKQTKHTAWIGRVVAKLTTCSFDGRSLFSKKHFRSRVHRLPAMICGRSLRFVYAVKTVRSIFLGLNCKATYIE